MFARFPVFRKAWVPARPVSGFRVFALSGFPAFLFAGFPCFVNPCPPRARAETDPGTSFAPGPMVATTYSPPASNSAIPAMRPFGAPTNFITRVTFSRIRGFGVSGFSQSGIPALRQYPPAIPPLSWFPHIEFPGKTRFPLARFPQIWLTRFPASGVSLFPETPISAERESRPIWRLSPSRR